MSKIIGKSTMAGKSTMLEKTAKGKTTKKNTAALSIYNRMLITKQLVVNIMNVGHNIKEMLGKKLASEIEGKCSNEGYIQPNSIEIITFSSGLVQSSNVVFEVVFQCNVCSPVEGMYIPCIAKNINKMGIRAEVKDMPSPVVIFVARDHNYNSQLFTDTKVNDEIMVRVIGQRYELNDAYISIIAEIVDPQKIS